MRLTTVFLSVSITLLSRVLCLAQDSRVDTDELMDIVFDLKKAAATADKVAADGHKYCHWGIPLLDVSDVDSAVSRFLLNHGSRVPDDILASNLWRFSGVAEDLVNQFEAGWQDCNRGAVLSRNISDVADSGRAVLSKLEDTKFEFDGQAYLQTTRQEWKYLRPLFDRFPGADDRLGAPGADAHEVLGAARELREAWDGASKAVIEAAATKDCQRYDGSGQTEEPRDLDKLIGRLSSTSGSRSYVPASDIWFVVAITTPEQTLNVQHALTSCNYYAIWRKKAKKVADRASDAEHRLKVAAAKLEALAFKQTEWEEQLFQQKGSIREQ
jgi:hypothetical protein